MFARDISPALPPDGPQRLLRIVLAPFPLFALQLVANRIVAHVSAQHPEVFRRLGENARKRILIDPADMPFILLLEPRPDMPALTLRRRHETVPHDARIAGAFLTLLEIIDSQMDSDALFFSRDISVDGDTGAIVALHHALDDIDGTLAESVATSFGPFSAPVMAAIGKFREIRSRQ